MKGDVLMSDSTSIMAQVRSMRKKNIVKDDVIGREIHIPTRAGSVRALYYTSGHENAPLFVDLHGGGFIAGRPENDDVFCHYVREKLDINVISIDYRLAPEYPCPSDKEDVYDAIRYVCCHPEEYGVDPDRVVVGGHSAGGNIAAVVSMMAKESEDFTICGQILDYPPMDLATAPEDKFYAEGAIPPEVARLFNECYCGEMDPREPICSPLFALNQDLRGLPPALVITCENDSLREEGEQYALRLAQNGVEVTLKRYLNVPHGFNMDRSYPQAHNSWRLIVSSLRKYLRL